MNDMENVTPPIYETSKEDLSIIQRSTLSSFQQRKALSPLNSFAVCRDDNITSNGAMTAARNKPPTKSRLMDRPPKALKSIHSHELTTNHGSSSTLSSSRNTLSRRRSSSTSSIQRLAHSYSHDSAGDDMSVSSMKSINSQRSQRSASSTRSVKSSNVTAGDIQTKAVVRGRSRDETDRRVRSRSNYSTLPVGTSTSSSSSSSSGTRGMKSIVGDSDSYHESNNSDVILKRYPTRSATNPTNKDSSSWLDEQRRIKEDRKVRSKQKPMESAEGEVIIHELNRSFLRIQQGYGLPTSKNDEETMETPSKKMAYTSLSNRIASGFRSPFKSPKIASIDSSIPHGSIPVQSSGVATVPSHPSKNLFDDITPNILADISGFDPNVSQVK